MNPEPALFPPRPQPPRFTLPVAAWFALALDAVVIRTLALKNGLLISTAALPHGAQPLAFTLHLELHREHRLTTPFV